MGAIPAPVHTATYKSGVTRLAITTCGVDLAMQNRQVPITRPRALHGAFLYSIYGVDSRTIGQREQKRVA